MSGHGGGDARKLREFASPARRPRGIKAAGFYHGKGWPVDFKPRAFITVKAGLWILSHGLLLR